MAEPEDIDIATLKETIIEGIFEKKGRDVVSIDLGMIDTAICDEFVISHADSGTQVKAIADSVKEKVRKTHQAYVWHSEGYDNAQWVLLDYANIVVHIFQTEFRDFYKLEDLWGDARIMRHEDRVKQETNNGRGKAK